jgi:hypothetical protein
MSIEGNPIFKEWWRDENPTQPEGKKGVMGSHN